MMFRLAPWWACVLGALMALPVFSHAQKNADAGAGSAVDARAVLPEVKVVSERVFDPQEFATSRTTQITAQDMLAQQASDIKEAIRYEPGVSVTNNPSRFGLAGFNIRGLDENRILMQVDGVRMSDTYTIGGYSNATRNMVDMDLLDVIHIQRGTGSSQHGSDALGGVVSYGTPSPEDMLDGQATAGSLKTLYRSVDDSATLVGTGAAGSDLLKVLVRGVWRNGSETRTKGTVDGRGIRRTKANPQEQDADALLFKAAYTPGAHYRAELSYQQSDRDIHTQVMSQMASGRLLDMNTTDNYRHEQWALTQRFEGLAVGKLDFKLYRQTSQTQQYTRQDMLPTSNAASEALIQRYFDFSQDSVGLKLDIHSNFSAVGEHLLTWGAEWSKTDTLQMRNGATTMLNGGVSNVVGPDTFPTRDTPPSDTYRWALYAHDEWYVTDALTLVAGGRYENYRLHPQPDAIYLSNEAAEPVIDIGMENVSPKLGAILSLGGGYSLAGQYAHGFRAPPYDDVNIGFSNQQYSYTAVANPNLKAETSRGVELSLRYKDAVGAWAISAFDTRYRDFIESEQLDCPSDPACSTTVNLTFQARNVPKVRIYGLEANFSRALFSGWSVKGALAYAKGRKTLTDEPLDSVNPLNGTLGVMHERGPWRYELSGTFAMPKKPADAERTEDNPTAFKRQFLSPSYAVFDMRMRWNFAKNGQLMLGVFNVFDRLYYQWSDIPVSDIHIVDSQAGPDRYSSPGRNFAATLFYRY
jgi:hemoglobin/transferrin/lactoferrin receptor protein